MIMFRDKNSCPPSTNQPQHFRIALILPQVSFPCKREGTSEYKYQEIKFLALKFQDQLLKLIKRKNRGFLGGSVG